MAVRDRFVKLLPMVVPIAVLEPGGVVITGAMAARTGDPSERRPAQSTSMHQRGRYLIYCRRDVSTARDSDRRLSPHMCSGRTSLLIAVTATVRTAVTGSHSSHTAWFTANRDTLVFIVQMLLALLTGFYVRLTFRVARAAEASNRQTAELAASTRQARFDDWAPRASIIIARLSANVTQGGQELVAEFRVNNDGDASGLIEVNVEKKATSPEQQAILTAGDDKIVMPPLLLPLMRDAAVEWTLRVADGVVAATFQFNITVTDVLKRVTDVFRADALLEERAGNLTLVFPSPLPAACSLVTRRYQ